MQLSHIFLKPKSIKTIFLPLLLKAVSIISLSLWASAELQGILNCSWLIEPAGGPEGHQELESKQSGAKFKNLVQVTGCLFFLLWKKLVLNDSMHLLYFYSDISKCIE